MRRAARGESDLRLQRLMLVFTAPLSKEFFAGFAGAPVVRGEIDARASGVAKQLSTGVVRIAGKQGIPVAAGGRSPRGSVWPAHAAHGRHRDAGALLELRRRAQQRIRSQRAVSEVRLRAALLQAVPFLR